MDVVVKQGWKNSILSLKRAASSERKGTSVPEADGGEKFLFDVTEENNRNQNKVEPSS